MKSVLRSIAAVLAGLLVLFTLVMAVELFSAVVYPFPEGFEGTKEEICRHVERYPQWVLAVVVPAWVLAAFASTWTARRIGNLASSAIVGLLLLAGLICNISMLPYPIWFKIANLLLIPIAILAGTKVTPAHHSAIVA
jgi:hypothetical protein